MGRLLVWILRKSISSCPSHLLFLQFFVSLTWVYDWNLIRRNETHHSSAQSSNHHTKRTPLCLNCKCFCNIKWTIPPFLYEKNSTFGYIYKPDLTNLFSICNALEMKYNFCTQHQCKFISECLLPSFQAAEVTSSGLPLVTRFYAWPEIPDKIKPPPPCFYSCTINAEKSRNLGV